MAEHTEIAWCNSTFNPWIGCTKVSPGCAHCYAERDFDLRKHVAKWGAGQPRHRTSEAYWRQPLKWNEARRWEERDSEACERDPGPRPRVFCASLADWLDEEVPVEWLADLLNVWRACSNLNILALTKRPHLWRQRLEEAASIGSDVAESWLDGHAPANVWIGTTVEDQVRADERIPALLSIPARVRFLSCEPLLGPVDLALRKYGTDDDGKVRLRCGGECCAGWPSPIHWVIAGGESGPHARPMHPDWARSLRDQCAAAGVPFLFKQWGEWMPINQMADGLCDRRTCTVPSCVVHFDGSCHDPIAPMAFRHGTGAMTSFKVGKRAAGRLLDGREHNEFPQ